MKSFYILIFLIVCSCGENKKEQQDHQLESQDSIDLSEEEAQKDIFKNDTIEVKNTMPETVEPDLTRQHQFVAEINSTQTKQLPLIDNTNFDSFIDEDDVSDVDVKALQLEKVYPNFYKEGYNFSTVTSYNIELSEAFHSVVVTLKKGDNEMETILINYDLNGAIIDYQVVAYDEIAEGMFRRQSKITKNKIIVHQIVWEDEPKIEQVSYEILENGIIEQRDSKVLNDDISNIPLVMMALDALKLNMLNVTLDLVASKEHPDNPDEIILVIPEIVEEREYYVELNNHILIINSRSGEVMQKTVVKGLTSEGEEDVIKDITIDTGPYLLNNNIHAFGILIYRFGAISVTPWKNENIELFVKSDDTLNSVLQDIDVMNYGGEIISDCLGGYTQNTSVLKLQTTKTNGYFDIVVETQIIDSENHPDGNGGCNTTEKHSIQTTLLKYNGSEYTVEQLN